MLGDPRVVDDVVGRLGLLGSRWLAVAEAVAAASGVAGTDREALEHLAATGPLTVAQLGDAVGIRSAAATALVDRLEGAGVAHRSRDARDRRRVLVEVDRDVLTAAARVTQPMERHLQAELAAMTTTQLRTVLAALDIALDAAALVTDDPGPPATAAPGGVTAAEPRAPSPRAGDEPTPG